MQVECIDFIRRTSHIIYRKVGDPQQRYTPTTVEHIYQKRIHIRFPSAQCQLVSTVANTLRYFIREPSRREYAAATRKSVK